MLKAISAPLYCAHLLLPRGSLAAPSLLPLKRAPFPDRKGSSRVPGWGVYELYVQEPAGMPRPETVVLAGFTY